MKSHRRTYFTEWVSLVFHNTVRRYPSRVVGSCLKRRPTETVTLHLKRIPVVSSDIPVFTLYNKKSTL